MPYLDLHNEVYFHLDIVPICILQMPFSPSSPYSWLVSQTYQDHSCLPAFSLADPSPWNYLTPNFNADLIFHKCLCSNIIFAEKISMIILSKFALLLLPSPEHTVTLFTLFFFSCGISKPLKLYDFLLSFYLFIIYHFCLSKKELVSVVIYHCLISIYNSTWNRKINTYWIKNWKKNPKFVDKDTFRDLLPFQRKWRIYIWESFSFIILCWLLGVHFVCSFGILSVSLSWSSHISFWILWELWLSSQSIENEQVTL